MPVVGFLNTQRPDVIPPSFVAGFRTGLAETGFVEGQNVTIEYRWAEEHLQRVPAQALDLVRRRVSVIFSSGGDVPTLVAKGATSTIPIVFTSGYDPVQMGLVASLNRPGGNVTGVTVITGALAAKRVEVLHEFVTDVRAVAMLVNPDNPGTEPTVADTRAAARSLGMDIKILTAGTAQEVDSVLAQPGQINAGALLVNPDPLFQSMRDRIVKLVAERALPAIYYSREYISAGGLISYGASFADMYRQAGIYVGRILKGERPGDLPVQQPTKFELVINLKTARALGLAVPTTLLARADEVIE
jgi:putative ABC transport system substrate-binding protein